MVLFAAPVSWAELPPVLVLDPDGPVHLNGAQMRFAPDIGNTLSDLAQRFSGGNLSASFANSASGVRPYQPLWGVVEIQSGAPR